MPDAVAHPTLRELAAFGLGTLPPAAAAAVAAHLEGCPACRQAVANRPPDSPGRQADTASPGGTALPEAPARPRGTPHRPGPPSPAGPALTLPPELAGHPRFRVLRELGRDGMDVAYQARQTMMNRLVAIKVVNPSLLAHPAGPHGAAPLPDKPATRKLTSRSSSITFQFTHGVEPAVVLSRAVGRERSTQARALIRACLQSREDKSLAHPTGMRARSDQLRPAPVRLC
jgi:hypothetical protein